MPSNNLVPHNLEAERALLGCILLDNAALYVALDRLTREDFFSQGHRIVFAAMVELKGRNLTVDTVTLCEELSRLGQLEKTGGAAYLASLTDGVPIGTSWAAVEYADIIKEKSLVRRLINASHNIIARCLEGVDNSVTLVELAHSQILDIAQDQSTAAGPQPISEIVTVARPALEKTAGSGVMLGEPTGFSGLDKFTAGWQEGEFVVVAGRPSMGKSALALDFAIHACKGGRAVGIFSLEMSKVSLLVRMACRIAKLDSHKMRQGFLRKEEYQKLSNALAEIAEFPLWVDDTPGLSIEQLHWRIRSLAQRVPLRLAIVDYIQLVTARGENRTQEVTRVSTGLQRAARELGRLSKGTLIGLSQLNRLAAGEEPQLHHLRESGSIEQDADVVLFLWDRVGPQPGKEADPIERVLKIGKQRNGPTGLHPFLFIPVWAGFGEQFK
jgi:replicative DNA helicase